ncbi:hypothetical protein [Marinilabilia salmonicolor]|uniref:hypothetical protein n=1 Tax=Marinilabilia salmonicolor TaxID=989 RepID=UPI001F31C10F|nr:hypothetical protein [Marinilabilia salmonicolor]
MSALAFCLADLQHQITPENPLDISEVSSLARLAQEVLHDRFTVAGTCGVG